MFTTRVKLKSVLVFLALLFLVTPTQAFFRHLCHGELGNGRVDPIVAPGVASQHLHVMFGASNMGLDPTLDDLLASNCTSCSILQDHSVYWTPRMYFQHRNGTFEMVPTSGGLIAYYFTEPDLTFKGPVTAFPQNFRMVAGNSQKRAFYGPVPDPGMSFWKGSDMTQQALMEKGIGFNCMNYNPGQQEGAREIHYMRNKTFIDAQCTAGIRAELTFPSCWNGQDLDSKNHSTHVAYPSAIINGHCPDGFATRLPTLFFETIYQTNLYAGVDGEFIFANGDPTGYGYHGDFMCGWEEGVLQSAIDNPACNMPQAPDGDQYKCPAFKVQAVDAGTTCKMETPEVLQNETINLVEKLPGNVPVQRGPEPATIPGAGTPAASTTAMASPATPTPGPSAAVSASSPITTLSPSTSQSQQTITTTYMSNGILVNMVLIEEVVTVTESDMSPTPNAHRKRHMHKHGH